MVGERADSATIARLRAELHLDDPIPAQFGRYVWAVMHGDLGRSYITQRPIAQDLAARFPKTVQLALAAMALAALCGIDRKSTRLNSSHITISYAVFCLKKK